MKMEEVELTVITVVYNGGKTIEESIKSVLTQSYQGIEYIIIDGGSKDKTIDIIKKYEEKIAYWMSAPDNGIYDAMNKGIKKSTGKYIYFLGADDKFSNKTVIEEIINLLTEDIISAPVFAVNYQYSVQRLVDNSVNIQDIFSGKMLPHQGMFVKTNIMKEYLFDLKYHLASDYDFLLKCISTQKNIKKISVPIAFYNVNGASSKYVEKVAIEYKHIMKKYNISEKIIDQYYKKTVRGKYTAICLKTLSNIFKFLGVYRYFLLYRGWQNIPSKNDKV